MKAHHVTLALLFWFACTSTHSGGIITSGGVTTSGGATISFGGATGTGGATISLAGGKGGTPVAGMPSTADTTSSTGGATITTLATGLQSPFNLVVDATSVYFLDCSGAGFVLMKVPIGGGPTTTILSEESSPSAFVVAGNNIYALGESTVMTVPVSGGQPVTLASGQVFTYGIATDSTNIYWTHLEGGGPIKKMPLAGGAPTTLAPLATEYSPSAIAVDATSVYWLNTTSAGYGLLPPYHTAIMKTSLGGGTPVILASDTEPNPRGGSYGIAVDATSVYWINTSNTVGGGFSTLMKVPIGGGTPTTLASGSFSPSAIGQIAVDATSVYWVNSSDYRSANGSVMAVAREGGTPTTLAARQTTAGGLAIDATSVYWTTGGDTYGDGAVLKTPKIPVGCDLTVASNALAALGITVVGDPQTGTTTLPLPLTSGGVITQWAQIASTCKDGGYDITPLAGKTICVLGQDMTQLCQGLPSSVAVLMNSGSVACIYKGVRAGVKIAPGIWSATSPLCTEPTIATGATVLCEGSSCTSATGPCCPALMSMNRIGTCAADCTLPSITCDGPEDCSNGAVCCSVESTAAGFGGTSCLSPPLCLTPNTRMICHQDADCQPSQHCVAPNPMPAYVSDPSSPTTPPEYWRVGFQVCAP